jgi:hypothetical protein
MHYSELVKYETEHEYKDHFVKKYCKSNILTFDGIPVRFSASDFKHAFYMALNKKEKDKSIFSTKRAERINWIEDTLRDPDAQRFYGWDNEKYQVDYERRVAITNHNYVVVITLIREKARFITAFVADDDRTLLKIKSSPKWEKMNR